MRFKIVLIRVLPLCLCLWNFLSSAFLCSLWVLGVYQKKLWLYASLSTNRRIVSLPKPLNKSSRLYSERITLNQPLMPRYRLVTSLSTLKEGSAILISLREGILLPLQVQGLLQWARGLVDVHYRLTTSFLMLEFWGEGRSWKIIFFDHLLPCHKLFSHHIFHVPVIDKTD